MEYSKWQRRYREAKASKNVGPMRKYGPVPDFDDKKPDDYYLWFSKPVTEAGFKGWMRASDGRLEVNIS